MVYFTPCLLAYKTIKVYVISYRMHCIQSSAQLRVKCTADKESLHSLGSKESCIVPGDTCIPNALNIFIASYPLIACSLIAFQIDKGQYSFLEMQRQGELKEKPESMETCMTGFACATGLAPAHVVLAQCDIVYDEGLAYANRLREAGNVITVTDYPACTHGFMASSVAAPNCGLEIKKGPPAIEETVTALNKAFYGTS